MLDIHSLRDIVLDIDLGFDAFQVGHFEGSTVMYVQHLHERPDAHTGVMGIGRGRKWHISPHATESEVVLTCLLAAITDAEHEVREGFRYKGKPIVHPHPSLRALLSIADVEEVRT